MNTTIKPTYFIIGATLMLSACAQEDISGGDEGGGERIIFHTSIPGVSSRATEIVTDFDYFFVTAFNPADQDKRAEDGSLSAYIDNVKIAKEVGQATVSSADCLWPEPQKEGMVSFFAYYPYLNEGEDAKLVNASKVNGSEAIIDYKIEDFQVAPDIAEQVDFVTAYATGSKTDNLFSGIELNFKHQLSRIEVKACGANKSCDIEIAGVRIGGVNVRGTFDFNPSEGTSAWSAMEKGVVEYIYRKDDEIIILPRQNELQSTLDAASIMGANLGDLGDENNCAMLIPTVDETGWEYNTDIHNENQGMYISVLLRVNDGNGKQQYPYTDNNQSENALNIPVIYLAVDKDTGKVSSRLYTAKEKTGYFTNEDCTLAYTQPENETIKEFGWAALPVTGEWEPGKIYTYTLDYSYGVGLHDPEDTNAGKSIISDKVIVNVKVSDWKYGDKNSFDVPRN